MADVRPKACIHLPLAKDLAARVDSVCEARHVPFGAPREELLAALADVEGVLLSNQIHVDGSVYDAAPRLRVVAGFGVGYDRFDVEEATRRGIAICNTPDVVTIPVADMTIGLILALTRRLFQNEEYVRSGAWARRDRPPAFGSDLGGKTLGVVGFGRIGKEITRRAQAFGMRTVFNDLFEEPPADAPQSPYWALDVLLREADVVTLHTDLNPTSYHLIGARELGLMKPTAFLINTSRGPVVDQPALLEALQKGTIAGAAVDVLEKEPPEPEELLVTLPNVLTFPHIGTATRETRRAMLELAVRNLLAVLQRETPPACLNPEVLASGRS
jgi:phosphoglycerate dehydrogenase-like enzyme